MLNQDGRKRKLLAGNVKGIFCIIQAITSPKAEPLKVWLATAGYEYQKTFHNYHQIVVIIVSSNKKTIPFIISDIIKIADGNGYCRRALL